MVQEVLTEAAVVAQRFMAETPNTFHLLLAVMRKDYALREWLEGKGVSINQLLAHAEEARFEEPIMGELYKIAREVALRAGAERHAAHLLYAIFSLGERVYANHLIGEFCDPDKLAQEILRNRWHRTPPKAQQEDGEEPAQQRGAQEGQRQRSILEYFGKDYTKLAREGKLKPIVGRAQEIKSILEILARKDISADYDEAINNPVLLGEAGVGKTALAKGIALMIARKDPRARPFWNHRLIYLPLGNLQAGTDMRGSFEARVEALLRECTQSPPTILFLDELHMVMNLGRTAGSPGLEEILKPVLAEGLSCIGATTLGEWRRDIETKNRAFAERWIQVIINEPSQEEALQILFGSDDDFARRHLVHFPSEVLSTSVSMGRRFMPYVASPRREVEILNGVGAKVKTDAEGRTAANVNDVAQVISQMTGMPVQIPAAERERIVQAPAVLSGEIIGQDEATRTFGEAILRFRSGMGDPERPLVILSLGPTGVGKTLTAKVVAKNFFFDRLVRVDMSEYMEQHTVSRLIGAPPGYIGYDDPGQLTEPIRRLGIAVVLLDEIEKAHPNVLNVLLQLFDDGRLTDGKGRTCDARNCLFVLSSNLGSEHYNAMVSGSSAVIGFQTPANQTRGGTSYEDLRSKLFSAARKYFPPEFYNRIDEVLVYRPLERDTIRGIARLLLAEEAARCSQKGFALTWNDEVVEYLVRHGFNPLYGARPMKRELMKRVQTLLAGPVFTGEITEGDTIILYLHEGKIAWRKEE